MGRFDPGPYRAALKWLSCSDHLLVSSLRKGNLPRPIVTIKGHRSLLWAIRGLLGPIGAYETGSFGQAHGEHGSRVLHLKAHG